MISERQIVQSHDSHFSDSIISETRARFSRMRGKKTRPVNFRMNVFLIGNSFAMEWIVLKVEQTTNFFLNQSFWLQGKEKMCHD